MERIHELSDGDASFQASFVSAAEIVEAKLYRPEDRWLKWISQPKRRWLKLLIVCSSLAPFPIGYVLLRQRFFLPEVIWFFIFTALVIQGIRLRLARIRNVSSRLRGIVLLISGLAGLIGMNLPVIQHGYRRCYLMKTLQRQGLDPILDYGFFGKESGWISVYGGWTVPKFVVDLFGGPAMCVSFAHVDLPQDMLSEELVASLTAPHAWRRPRVNLLPSKLKRPPDLIAFQALVDGAELYEMDATWFDQPTFDCLNSSSQGNRVLRFDGVLSDDAIHGIRMKSSGVPIELLNLPASDFAKLGSLPSREENFGMGFQFKVKSCEWTPQIAVAMARLRAIIYFADFEPENLALCSELGVNLPSIPWNGSMTKEQAACIASNRWIQYLEGNLILEPGAVQAISRSRSIRALPTILSPIRNEELASLSQMALLERLTFEHCEADYEAVRQLAAKPNLKIIDIRNGKLSRQELDNLYRDFRAGKADVRQSTRIP